MISVSRNMSQMTLLRHFYRSPILMKSSRFFSSYPAHVVVGMPALSPTMTSGVIAKWNCKVGDLVKPGETYAEVETDKASIAFEAQEESYIAKLLVEPGSEVSVGSAIMVTVDDSELVPAFSQFKLTADKAASAPVAPPPATTNKQAVTIEQPRPTTAAPLPSSPVQDAQKQAVTAPNPPAAQPALKPQPQAKSDPPTSAKPKVVKSFLTARLSKEQALYNEKYGWSLHNPL